MAFPAFEDSAASDKIRELHRLMDPTLRDTDFADAAQASRLFAALVSAHRDGLGDDLWHHDRHLARASAEGNQLGLALAAIFDLIVNIEYYRGRVTSSNWIYCHRDDRPDHPRLGLYSALKQCPRCCLDRGLTRRMTDAQHKPSSHHIGEISTTICALILKLLASAHNEPLEIATITKQSHDVDAVAYRDDLLVLLEVKASPMVTFPLACIFGTPLLRDAVDDDGETGQRVEYEHHSLVDVPVDGTRELFLYMPHRDKLVPMGSGGASPWPYPEAIDYFRDPHNFLEFFSAWLELFYAYSVPKRQRADQDKVLAYLVNGWGDEIDSNKTKPGLGRTDDIKKGTYQLIKFGAYYRDVDAPFAVRTALVANLDPIFLREDYIDKLEMIRWGQHENFVPDADDSHFTIESQHLHYLYEAILAFNAPVLNDPLLAEVFGMDGVAEALSSHALDDLLAEFES